MRRLIPLLFLAACSHADWTPDLDAPYPSELGVHVHPNDWVPETETARVCEHFRHIRMQLLPDTENVVQRTLDAMPVTCDAILIVWGEGPDSAIDLARVTRMGSHPRVAGVQLSNEPNNCHPAFPCLDPNVYAAWVDEWAPQVRAALPADKLVVLGATTPLWSDWPHTLGYLVKVLQEVTAVDSIDVLALHVYGTHVDRIGAYKWAWNAAKERAWDVWVTEYGAPGDEGKAYARGMPATFLAKGIPIHRWYRYAWNDPFLGYAVREEVWP